ncbi:amino-acid acetyltransferase, partial [Nannochloropsis oceanica]
GGGQKSVLTIIN